MIYPSSICTMIVASRLKTRSGSGLCVIFGAVSTVELIASSNTDQWSNGCGKSAGVSQTEDRSFDAYPDDTAFESRTLD